MYRLANTGQIEKQRQHHERKKDDRKRAREFNSGDGRDEPSRKTGRGALSYEGVRASKADGKPGKWTGSNEKLAGATKKSPKRAGGALAEPKAKRPAVAARKAAILNMKNGGGSGVPQSKPKPPVAGTKRKRDDRGGKKRKRDDRGGKASRGKKRR